MPSFGGKLVPPGDENALSKSLLDALQNAIAFEADRTIEHIRDKFSMDNLLDRLENVYSNLIASED